jgi:hypothetical protein
MNFNIESINDSWQVVYKDVKNINKIKFIPSIHRISLSYYNSNIFLNFINDIYIINSTDNTKFKIIEIINESDTYTKQLSGMQYKDTDLNLLKKNDGNGIIDETILNYIRNLDILIGLKPNIKRDIHIDLNHCKYRNLPKKDRLNFSLIATMYFDDYTKNIKHIKDRIDFFE